MLFWSIVLSIFNTGSSFANDLRFFLNLDDKNFRSCFLSNLLISQITSIIKFSRETAIHHLLVIKKENLLSDQEYKCLLVA